MRAGSGCTVQQTLTSEAASILKHSLSLARRRGHAQVTPLHVASILLASKFSLFKRACLKSQSQPSINHHHLLLHHHHQSRALELCFNVALNRLPTIPPTHAGHLLQPSFSNALIAALKRAQAHQRKGSITEQQQQQPQQPILAIKVELEQLILSILDDPSVSRVMREAGFSSTAVKTNLQEYYSSVSSVFQFSSSAVITGIYSTPNSPPTSPPIKKFDQLLGLSLNANTSKYGGEMETTKKPLMKRGKEDEEEEEDFFTNCCPECTSNYEKELVSKNSSSEEVVPHWLNLTGTNVAHKEYSFQLKRKWSKLCQSLHRSKQNGDLFSMGKNCYSSFSSSPTPHQYWWPSYNYNRAFSETKPISFASNNASLLKPIDYQNQKNSVPKFRRQQSCHIEFNFSTYSEDQEEKDKEAKITLALGSSLFSDPDGLNPTQQLQTKCDNNSNGRISEELLKEIVPWQSKNIPGILEVIRESSETMKNKNIWLIFHGNDSIGKRKLALGIAEKVLGSTDFFLGIDLIRQRDKCSEVVENAMRKHGRLVVLLENIEFADTEFLKFLVHGWKSEKFGSGRVIFILSKLDSTTNCSREEIRGEKRDSVIEMKLVMDNIFPRTHLCSDHKRKIEWDDFTGKKKLTKQVSSNILDLNVKAEEELSSITTATADIITRNHHLGFLDLIENRFLLNREPKDDNYIKDLILSKIEGSFEKVFGNDDKKQSCCFSVEENVLEKLVMCYGSFLDSLFEKWLKDIFQTSLSRINGRMEEGIVNTVVVKLCLGSNNKNGDDLKKKKEEEEGFMGSCLPKNVEVCLS